MKVARKTLKEEAFEWALERSQSKAATPAGKARAVENWLAQNRGKEISFAYSRDYDFTYFGVKIDTLEQAYLDHQQAIAPCVMRSDLRHREAVAKERKQIKKHPVWVRHHIATTPEVDKTYRHAAGSMKTIPAWIENVCKDIALGDIFAGTRYRKAYRGNNDVYPGLRTNDNGKGGWDRVVWHYADYTAIADQSGKRIAFRSRDTRPFEIFYSFNSRLKARGEIYTRPKQSETTKQLSPHHQRRFYTLAIPANSPVQWVWDMDEKAGYYLYGEEKYHTVTMPDTKKTSRDYLHEAVHAFQKRKKEKIAVAKAERTFRHLDRVYVTVEDSIASGNCVSLTEQMRDKIAAALHAEGEFAVRADYLWQIRSDTYTRRAILKAAEHVPALL